MLFRDVQNMKIYMIHRAGYNGWKCGPALPKYR